MVKHYEDYPIPAAWISSLSESRGKPYAATLTNALQYYEDRSSSLLASQAVAIADMLHKLELDSETILAALLYPAMKNHLIHPENVEESYGVVVAKLLHDCMQMQSLSKVRDIHKDDTHQIENLRKMLLAMVTDIRAVLIILAERLWQLRDAKSAPVPEQKKLARETLDIYAPLANRIGIWQLKWEIEDLCLRYQDPETYTSIAKWLATRRTEREHYLAKATDIFTSILKKGHVEKFEMTGRVKHIYSINNKMQRKGVPIEEIYDISALRVLVPEIADCYTVLSLLQAEYQRIPHEFDDYIAQPKPNGYQSIHTVLYGPENRIIEVQIRTDEMHHTSELGAASHWRYKEALTQEAAYEVKIALLRQIMAWQKEVAKGSEEKLDQPEQDIFADRIYVFTPQGDIIDLPQGATPLDFAYHVHSEVGHRCRGAKVDGKMVSLTHALQTGNRVEIMTAKEPNPSRDWLNVHLGYLKSSRARSILAHWFRIKDSASEKDLRKTKPVPVMVPLVKKTMEHHHEMARETTQKSSSGNVTGVDSLLTKFALCCKPLPGDPIIGYITQNRGVSIHRRDCSNIANLTRNDMNRFMEVSWGKTPAGRYPVDIVVRVLDRSNLLRDITGSLSNADVHVAGLRTQLHADGEASVFITVMITSVAELNHAVQILEQIHNVQDVRRV
jgi:GTP pyrophosphokinase